MEQGFPITFFKHFFIERERTCSTYYNILLVIIGKSIK